MKESVLNQFSGLTNDELANLKGGLGFCHILSIAEFGKGFIDGLTGH
ncbi:ComC/BlpC family leader-containing pheromone/bacteriocin [Fructobacillus sp. M2-14]|uniref:ComC/BlpC family leader-containing pheromone/bacteriocin n=1 Tax=Fructobacillus broussonetiae TaxID=2713173 RepID=A0ABS5R4F1_9LACO|nr:ComC/BlpC family leader-containing pheromone/bacteriocin [Fructobacillus broussonetiae]MBS9339027.1 ComC/BlpC family leader-containing pheromone/bacteriocin [Fructobacillus broussonetiae]